VLEDEGASEMAEMKSSENQGKKNRFFLTA